MPKRLRREKNKNASDGHPIPWDFMGPNIYIPIYGHGLIAIQKIWLYGYIYIYVCIHLYIYICSILIHLANYIYMYMYDICIYIYYVDGCTQSI